MTKSSTIPIVAKITNEQTNGSPSLKILERFANRFTKVGRKK